MNHFEIVDVHQNLLFSIRRQTNRKGNPMHAAKLLHDLFDKTCKIDKRIKRALFLSAETLTHCKQLSISSIGRHLPRSAKIKNNIKCIDRLFNNANLYRDGTTFYQSIAHHLIKNEKRPLILIDASRLTRCGTYHVLRASLPSNGRSLTLYDAVYLSNEYQKAKTHSQFLKTLKHLLPVDCKPIIVTDAGFRNTWFKQILSYGWDFVGRVRSKTCYRHTTNENWKPITEFYQQAKLKTAFLGQVILAKSNSIHCYLYLTKQRKKHRQKRNLMGDKVRSSQSKKHERRENEPWLIASSLKKENADEVMMIYKKRMQIEEAFRDLKSTRTGFGLRHCRSFSRNRLWVALLISNFAVLTLWLFAIAAKQRHLHYSFQANTEKRRNVLSNFTIGWQVVARPDIRFFKRELMKALIMISTSIIEEVYV